MGENMALMYEWFERVGYSVDIEALRRNYSEVKWERFEDWAVHQDWSVLDAAKEAASWFILVRSRRCTRFGVPMQSRSFL